MIFLKIWRLNSSFPGNLMWLALEGLSTRIEGVAILKFFGCLVHYFLVTYHGEKNLLVKESGVKYTFYFNLLKLHCGSKAKQLRNFSGNFPFHLYAFLSIPLDWAKTCLEEGFPHYLVQYCFSISDQDTVSFSLYTHIYVFE